MVTTIKITCDGVFIQSNSYNNNNISSSITTTTTATTTSAVMASSRSENSIHQHSGEKDESSNSSLPTTTAKSGNNCFAVSSLAHSNARRQRRELNNSNISSSTVNNGISCEIRSVNRKHYYFGNSNIYWCKQNIASGSVPLAHSGVRSRNARKARTSICNCLQKEEKGISGLHASKDFVHICNKLRTQRQFSSTKSIILGKPLESDKLKTTPLSLMASSSVKENRKFHTDTSLLSFLRDISVRNFYRTGSERQKNFKNEIEVNGNSSMMLKLRSTFFASIIDRLPSPSTTTKSTDEDRVTNKALQAKISNDWLG